MGTYRQALVDPSVALHWVIDLSVGGDTLRYATAEVDIDGHHYSGCMEVKAPKLEVDPYDGTSSAVVAKITLHPQAEASKSYPLMKPYDIEEVFGNPLVGMPGKLYRWAAGTIGTERDLIIDGYVRNAQLDGKGRLQFDLVDISERYDRVKLPTYICTSDVLTNIDPDYDGARGPIAYGTFSGLKVPRIDTVQQYHLIAHHIASVTGGKIGTSSSTPVLTNTTDSSGVEYAQLDYNTVTADLATMVDGTGMEDDAAGTYTGTAAALISNIADILRHLAVEIVGVPADNVDESSFIELRKYAVADNALTIDSSDETSLFDVAADSLRPYRAALFFERGYLVARHLRLDDAMPISHSLRLGERLISVESIEWRGYEETPSSLEVKYDRGYVVANSDYEMRGSYKVDSSDYAPFVAATALGNEELVIEAPYITAAADIVLLVEKLLELYGKARRTMTVVCTRETHDVKIFDCILVTTSIAPSIDGSGWSDKRFVVTGIEYGLETNTLDLLEV